MPASETQLKLEAQAQEACAREDFDLAATRLIEAYGADLLRFLSARLGDRSAAAEVYSEVAERLWRGLPNFVWRHGARAYCYAIARNTAINYVSAAGRRPARNLPLSAAGLSAAVERVRSETLPYLRTEVKDRFRELREQLPADDQTLLALRLDRGLEWRELALVMSFDGDTPEEDALTREAARLRQRFKSAKDKLRRYAQREGLIE
jgi:RNA polymerase sigma-70 factor (ECF subfamily)